MTAADDGAYTAVAVAFAQTLRLASVVPVIDRRRFGFSLIIRCVAGAYQFRVVDEMLVLLVDVKTRGNLILVSTRFRL